MQAVAREIYADSTLAQLYDLDMPTELIEAHHRLDRAVDRAFGLTSNPVTEKMRVRKLFEMYSDVSASFQAPVTVN